MMKKRVLLIAVILASVCQSLSGCSSGEGVPQKIAGTVTMDNQPLRHATIEFVAQAKGKEGVRIGGGTGANGKFEITLKPASMHLKPGAYTVLVSKFVDKDGKMPVYDPNNPEDGMDPEQQKLMGLLRNALPKRYGDPATSNLQVELKIGDNTNLQIKLTSK